MANQAYKFNNLDDDPILSDGSSNFSGVVSATKNTLIDNSELADLSNGDIGAYGTAGARPPAKLIGKSLSDDFYADENSAAYEDENSLRYAGPEYVSDTQKIWVYKGQTPKIMFFAAGKLYTADSLSASAWNDSGLENLNPNAIVSVCQLARTAYFTDGNSLRWYDGSEFGTVENFKSISESGEIEDSTPIPPATCVETHVERLCLAGIKDTQHDPGTIFFSDYLDGKTWLITESIQVGADGDEIIALKSWKNNTLLVFKASSVWAVICSPLVDDSGNKLSPAYWTVNKISDSYGAVSRETVTQVGNDVWFLSKRGLCSVQRAVAADDNEMQALPISTPIQDYVDRINWNAAMAASAVYFKDRFFLSIPLDSSPRPNITLVYNTITQKWQGKWQGTSMRATGFAKGVFGGVESLLWRTHDGSAYTLLDDDTSGAFDACEGVNEYYEQKISSKSYVWDAPLNDKRALDIELEFYNSSGTAALSVRPDGKDEIPIASDMRISTSKKLPLKVPFSLGGGNTSNFKYNLRDLPRCRSLQAVIRTKQGRATLRMININAIVEPR